MPSLMSNGARLANLRLFAERLQDIPPSQIRVVATATLRLTVNAGAFYCQRRRKSSIVGTGDQR